jgi:tRNA (uracil-5-)-methyltransferase
MHSYGDLVEIVKGSEGEDQWRDDSRIQCKYFGTCGGCQYQMLSYERQLALKREVVVKAYRNFSKLPEHLIPNILDTLPSPRQYGYRTKLTPHFDAPTNEMKRNGGEGLRIGFQQKGRRTVMDIEECPIGTEAINEELIKARQDVRR